MTKEEKIRNVLCFLAILSGEERSVFYDKVMEMQPDYILEKFERYILSLQNESDWGLHPMLRRSTLNRYCDKWNIPRSSDPDDEDKQTNIEKKHLLSKYIGTWIDDEIEKEQENTKMKIYKYAIPDTNTIISMFTPFDRFALDLPMNTKILTFQVKDAYPYLWCVVPDEPHNDMVTRHFEIYGTGQDIECILTRSYIGTIQIDVFVWHLFEVTA